MFLNRLLLMETVSIGQNEMIIAWSIAFYLKSAKICLSFSSVWISKVNFTLTCTVLEAEMMAWFWHLIHLEGKQLKTNSPAAG